MSLPNFISDASANRFKKTYFNGFVDISGGDILLRGNNVIVREVQQNDASNNDYITKYWAVNNISGTDILPLNNTFTGSLNTFTGNVIINSNLDVSGNLILNLNSLYVNSAVITLPSTSTTLIGNNTTDTLTNKTLSSPVISTIVNTGTLTLPTSTDTLVGRATTDTLTNKTLTSPIISSISNTGTVTLPTINTTLVGRSTTDTLTNKTLTDCNANTQTLGDNSSKIATTEFVSTAVSAASDNVLISYEGNPYETPLVVATELSNWNITKALPATAVRGCAMTYNGLTQIYTKNDNTMVISLNGGQTLSTASVTQTTENFSDVAMSATGQYVLLTNAGVSARPYLSTNYGVNFTQLVSTFLTTNHKSCAVSASGKYMLVTKYTFQFNPSVSSDYGANWTGRSSGITDGGIGKMSANGQYMYIFSTVVKRSANFGASFSTIAALTGIGNLTEGGIVSPSGRVVATGVVGASDLRVSYDFGVTFVSVTQNIPVMPSSIRIACSWDGMYSTIIFGESQSVYKSNRRFQNFTAGTIISRSVIPNVAGTLPYGNAMSINGQLNIATHSVWNYYGYYAVMPMLDVSGIYPPTPPVTDILTTNNIFTGTNTFQNNMTISKIFISPALSAFPTTNQMGQTQRFDFTTSNPPPFEDSGITFDILECYLEMGCYIAIWNFSMNCSVQGSYTKLLVALTLTPKSTVGMATGSSVVSENYATGQTIPTNNSSISIPSKAFSGSTTFYLVTAPATVYLRCNMTYSAGVFAINGNLTRVEFIRIA